MIALWMWEQVNDGYYTPADAWHMMRQPQPHECYLLIIDEYEQVPKKHKRALAKIFLESKRETARWLKQCNGGRK